MNGTRRTKKQESKDRREQLLALKAEYDMTWAEIAEISGYSWGVLKHFSCGTKPVSARALDLITFKLAEHASKEPVAVSV